MSLYRLIMYLFASVITTTGCSSVPCAETDSLAANPKHVELFDHRNFCVVCTFNDAELSPDTLHNSVHYNANISASYVYGTVMDGLDLTFAFMYAIKGERFTIKNSKVHMINLTYSDLPYFTFINNQGSLVNFTGSGLNYGNFRDVELKDAIFSGTALWETNFTNAWLPQSQFINAYLNETNFTNAQLPNSDFTDATLVQVDFTNANLLGAKINEEQLADTIVCNAILPDGSRGHC